MTNFGDCHWLVITGILAILVCLPVYASRVGDSVSNSSLVGCRGEH